MDGGRLCFCFSVEVKKDKDLEEEKSPKTEKDDPLEQIDSVKQEIAVGKEALRDKAAKDDVRSEKPVVGEETASKAVKEEPMEDDEAFNNTSKSTSEKNGGPLPSEHTREVKKSSDEIQKALKNDQQAKIPLKKREMKRSEDFDTANCGSGGSSIIVRNPAVKDVRTASEENGLRTGENLNGNVSPAVAVEGDGKASDDLQIKQKEPPAISEDQQADAEVKETKKQLSDAKQEEGHEEKQKKEEETTYKSQTSTEESMEVEESAVAKGDQETSPQVEEAAQTTETSSGSEVIRLQADSEKDDESAETEVAKDCSKPLDEEAPEKSSETKPTDQAETESKPKTSKETPNERDTDQERELIKHESGQTDKKNDTASNENADAAKDDKTQTGTEAPMETERSTSEDSAQQQSTAQEQSELAVQKADEPGMSEETKSPVDETTSTTLKDSALLEGDEKPESGSTKQTEKQERPKEENIPVKENEESEPLNKGKEPPEDSDVSNTKEKPSSPKENERTEGCEKSAVCEETDTEPAAKESLKSDRDRTPDKTTPDAEGPHSVATQKESADQEKQDVLKKSEEPPTRAVSKTEEVVKQDKPMEVTSAHTEDNKVPTDNKDCDAEPKKEACSKKGVQDEHPVEESKASTEESSENRKENGDQKSTSEKEANLSGESTEDQNRAEEKTKTGKGEADDRKELPQEAIRLKIKVPAHRRRAELQREEGKGDSESEASEGRCLRRSPRICRPTAKLAEIQDRKVEKKQVTPSVEKEKEENEEKDGDENAVQKKPREKKVDQEGQAKPKVCLDMLVL